MDARRLVWLVLGAALACSTPAETPPPSVDAGLPVTTDTSTKTFAIAKLYLGDASRTGVKSDTAWKSFGFDLDGKVTTGSSTDVCTRPSGAPSSNQGDGVGGIDNAFASVILPLVRSAFSMPNVSDVVSPAYENGRTTLQVRIVGLTGFDDQTASGLRASWLRSGSFAGDGAPGGPFPGFDPSLDWPVRTEALVDGVTLGGPATYELPRAWVVQGRFVDVDPWARPAMSDVTVPLVLPFADGVELTLLVHHAIVVFSASRGESTDGVVAGVLDPDELAASFVPVLRQLGAACGPDVDGVAAQLHQAADILLDGTNVRGKACNGISIGVGFDARRIANPTRVAKDPLPKAPDPCP